MHGFREAFLPSIYVVCVLKWQGLVKQRRYKTLPLHYLLALSVGWDTSGKRNEIVATRL